ncbi:pyridoxal phosphate-dependent aminotransferase [Pelagibacterium halotolerans]|uniref:pyridoxal phosphate-dependent aminotransferase n=1 Tax=Pelagibacterium halotolerans TaxID=531813 RepID=UPI00384A9769
MTLETIRPFYAMEILGRAQAREADGHSVCHLEIGEPGGAPSPAVRAAVKACIDRPMGYTSAKGMRPLRERLARYYDERHGVAVDPERIMITMGSSSGFILSFLGAFPPGARIAVTRPGYPAYLNILSSLHMQVAEIPVRSETGWKPTVEDIETAYAQAPFDGFLLASPANPTGAVLDADELAQIVACCERLGVRFISDEIYHGLNYVGRDVSALETSSAPIVVNSFSKYYCMTGWRIGWLVLPEDLVRRVEMMAQSLFISASSVSQMAALAALDERTFYDARRDAYAQNRLLLARGLERLGFKGARPSDGAFYVYVDASPFTNDTMDFCIRLLEDTGVATTPGADFDRTDGHQYVRFSYAGTRETIEEAIERTERFLRPVGRYG